MIGGSMKMTSRFALVAAAGLLLGATVSAKAVKAADLGGGCCADLEERVAELEATTARKGNRVVSLQIYGQVNKGLLIWDDGQNSDAYIVDTDESGTRMGAIGTATISPGMTAGFNIEYDLQQAPSNDVSATNDNPTFVDGGDTPESEQQRSLFGLRIANLYVESARFGRVTIGHGSAASDYASEVVLGNSLSTSNILVGNSFVINGSGSKLSSWTSNLDGSRNNNVRYNSPEFYGFIASASWGENDQWDAALRFKKEWNSIRVAAALAYQDSHDDTLFSGTKGHFTVVDGSISVMHVPTGIYGAFAAGSKDFDDKAFADPSFWYVQGGIEKKFLPYGSTTLYADYGIYDDFIDNGSEATRWGLGIVQKIDSAAMDIYAKGYFYSFDQGNCEGSCDDLSMVLVGSRIKF